MPTTIIHHRRRPLWLNLCLFGGTPLTLFLLVLATLAQPATTRPANTDPPARSLYPTAAERLPNPNVWGGRDDTAKLKAIFELAGNNENVPVRPRVGYDQYILTETLVIKAHGTTFDTDRGTVVIDWKGPSDRPMIVMEGCNKTKLGTKGELLFRCAPDFPLWGGLYMRNTKEPAPLPMTRCVLNNVTIEATGKGGLRFAALVMDPNGREANNDLHTFNNFNASGAGGAYAGFYSGYGTHQSHQLRFIGGGMGGFRFGSFVQEGFILSESQNMADNDADFYFGAYHYASEIRNCNSERSRRAIEGRHIDAGPGNLGGANLVVQTYRFSSYAALPDPIRWRSGAGILSLNNFQSTNPPDRPAIFRSRVRGGIVADRLSERYGDVREGEEVEPIEF